LNITMPFSIRNGFVAAIAVTAAANAWSHPGHVEDADDGPSPILIALQDAADTTPSPARANATTGQGNFRFKLLHSSSFIPQEAQEGLLAAHGGFAEDRRDGKGDIYFALPRVGILHVAANLSSVEILDTDSAMKPLTMHNTTIWYSKRGNPYLTFPGVDGERIFTTSLDGTLVQTLGKPDLESYDNRRVTKYFERDGKFVPTDVEYANNRFYITTGYSPLDFVLTAEVKSKKKVSAKWSPMVFGGRGTGPGEFGTGHGITLEEDGKTLSIADRPNAEIDRFDLKGTFLDTINLPKGSFPCDTDYVNGLLVVGCLHGPDREKGAPIYILKDKEIVSTVMIKEDLGLERFQHIHNSIMVKRNGKFYIIAQAWNPGGFAILEQVN
jgi:6-bladed beta-propeller